MTGTSLIWRSGARCTRSGTGCRRRTRFTSAQLPMLVRGLYFEGWHMAGTPTKERTRADFCDHIRSELPKGSAIDPNLAARSVFGVMWEKLDLGEIGKVIERLPPDLQELWR
jgi:uncharacterized protein (DUF2267 family)